MARKKKQVDLEEAIADRKNSDLTEDERHALHLRHCREFEVAVAAKKGADAALKTVAKRIKAEQDTVAKCKKTLAARTPEGEALIRAEIAEAAEVLRWAGVSIGESKDLFPVDRMPATDRAFAEGKRGGLDGETCRPPYDPSVPQYQAFIDGWQEGQKVIASGFMEKLEPIDTRAPVQSVTAAVAEVASEFGRVDPDDTSTHEPDPEMPAAPPAPAADGFPEMPEGLRRTG